MTERDIMTLKEVAQYLNVHPSTVYKMTRKGEIPAFRIGTDWRFARESIEKWVKNRESRFLASN